MTLASYPFEEIVTSWSQQVVLSNLDLRNTAPAQDEASLAHL